MKKCSKTARSFFIERNEILPVFAWRISTQNVKKKIVEMSQFRGHIPFALFFFQEHLPFFFFGETEKAWLQRHEKEDQTSQGTLGGKNKWASLKKRDWLHFNRVKEEEEREEGNQNQLLVQDMRESIDSKDALLSSPSLSSSFLFHQKEEMMMIIVKMFPIYNTTPASRLLLFPLLVYWSRHVLLTFSFQDIKGVL